MLRILLVDDEDAYRQMMTQTLTEMGYEVMEARNGKEAVQVHELCPADAVLTDLIMPDTDGIEIIREFKRIHPSVKIIAMSGGGWVGTRDYLKAAKLIGADETLTKPFSKQELSDALERLCGKQDGAGPAPSP
ncbi:MAG: response regulator [Opitutaceae bacterium]|jgi:YesN/AraC family two-component response regulator